MNLPENDNWTYCITDVEDRVNYFTVPKVVRTFPEFMLVDVVTGDSDPVYYAVARASKRWGKPWATRFSVAMLAYYHTGVAVKAADYEGLDFWKHLSDIYPTAPRGSERRHFRADLGKWALASMEKYAPNPDDFFDNFGQTYLSIRSTCEARLVQFGPYFQLKICDFMDRCLEIPILSFAGLEKNLPTEPAKAVGLMFPGKQVSTAFLDLCKQMESYNIPAPPRFDRPCGPAEVETSLCGWKTTKYKGNWFGADIIEKREALKGYGDKARLLADMMPQIRNKSDFKLELV